MALQKVVWDSATTDLVLKNPDSGETFRNTILEMLAVSPSDVRYQYENGNLIFVGPSGFRLTIEDVPFKGNPFHVQYFEQTGEWFGNNDAQVFNGVAGASDYFAGNGSDDVYRWGKDSGVDTINNWESTKTSQDIVEVVGLSPQDITVIGEGRDLVLRTENGDSLRILNHLADSYSAVNEIHFEDGTVWDQAQIRELVTVYLDGTAGDDVVRGSETDDVLDGKGGDDTLIGFDGDDTYVWGEGSGSDVIQNWESGHEGVDVVKVGFQSDDVQFIVEGRDLVLLSNSGDSLRILNHMADSHSAVDRIEFSDGAVFDRAAIVTEASTTYSWGAGSGDIVLENYQGQGFSEQTLKITGLKPSEISYSHINGALVFTSVYGDTLTIKDVPFKGNPFDVQYFEQTGEWFGNNDAQVFNGVAGASDYFAGNGSDDVYRWGKDSGVDTINNWESTKTSQDIVEVVGLSPQDITVIGEGRDLVLRTENGDSLRILNHLADSYSAVNEIHFEDGTVWDQAQIRELVTVYLDGTAGDDVVRGSETDDVLDGKGGDDTLIGFDGDDTYVWGEGSGSDVIQNWESSHEGVDVVFIKGFSVTDVLVTGEGRDLVLRTENGDSLRILNHLADSYSAVNEIHFEDGTVWDQAQIRELVTVYLDGTAGDDVVRGSETDDVLDGKGGDDTLIGFDGDDTYVWGEGSGSDVIQNWESGHEGVDVVKVGFQSDDVQFIVEGRDLVLLSNSGDSLRILNHMADSHSAVDRIEFSDGAVFDRAAIVTEASTTYSWGAGSGDIVLENYQGQGFSEQTLKITGLKPSEISYSHINGALVFTSVYGDTLTIKDVPFKGNPFDVQYFEQTGEWFGNNDAQVFNGVAGASDYFAGNGSDDVYRWGKDSGVDTINNWESTKTSQDIVEVVGLSPQDITVIGEGRDLVLRTENGDSLRILNHLADSYSAVNEIHFEDGTVWDQAQIRELVTVYLDGTAGDDVVRGSETDDVLDGKGGDDTLIGFDGDDTYVWGEGSGSDVIQNWESGHEGVDVVKVGFQSDDVQFIVEGRDLVLLSNSGDSLRILNHMADSHSAVDRIEFSDGAVFDRAAIVTEASTTYSWGAGSGDIVLENYQGQGFSEQTLKITGLKPSEISYSHINGALVFTSVYGDTLTIKDVPFKGNPFDVQYFEQTGEWFGNNDAQVFNGVAGASDYFAGNGSDDVYRWGKDSGVDTINNWESTKTSQDIVEVVGLSPQDITVIGEGRDLVLRTENGDSLRILNHLADSYSAVNEIHFEDGTVWDQAQIRELVTVYLDGTAGDDVVRGSETDDVLDGKGGDDTLIGFDGDDTYVWGEGSGSDVIQNWESGHEGVDVVKVGFQSDDVQFIVEGRDLVLLSNSGDSLRILNHMADSHSAVDRIEFSDGAVFDRAAIVTEASTTYSWGAGSGDIVLENYQGQGFSEQTLKITGLKPSEISYSHINGALVFTSVYGDTLTIKDVPFKGNPFDVQYFEQTGEWFGNNDAQVFNGVAGASDYFAGNGSDDVYRWGKDSGVDTINNWESTKTSQDIVEVVGLSPQDITVIGEGRDLVLRTENGDSLRILNHLADSYSAVNEIHFEDGTVWDQAQIRELVTVYLDGTAGDDVVRGSETDDVLDGKGGDDTLIGFDGDDTYVWGEGSGSDVIQNWESGHEGVDVVKVGFQSDDVQFIVEGRDLVLLSNSGDSLRILNHMADSHSAVDRIEFADGAVYEEVSTSQFTTKVSLGDVLKPNALDDSWSYTEEATERPSVNSDSQQLELVLNTDLSLGDVLSIRNTILEEMFDSSTDANSSGNSLVGGDATEYPVVGDRLSGLIEDIQLQLANSLEW